MCLLRPCSSEPWQMPNQTSSSRQLFVRPILLWLVVAFLGVGCGVLPEKVSLEDARVQLLLRAAAAFDRGAYGFSPLPTNGDVRLESKPRPSYDAMLHLTGKTSRTIAFRKNGSGYYWIGEQESFQGPTTYKSPDGTFHEQVVLTFEIEHVSGVPLNQLDVSYFGEDSRLDGRRGLSLSDVRPILKEWGY